MLQYISKNLTQYFLSKNIITKNQIEACEYSIHTRLMKLIFILSILAISLAFNVFIESIIFLILVLSLRRRTGGYHANSEIVCFIFSIGITIFATVFLADFINSFNNIFRFLIYINSVFILFLYAPINHPNLEMSDKEMRFHRNKMKKEIFIVSLILITFELFNQSLISSLLISGVMLVASSVLISKIIKQEVYV